MALKKFRCQHCFHEVKTLGTEVGHECPKKKQRNGNPGAWSNYELANDQEEK